MNVRPDIAALIAAGHSDAAIAARLGCHRATVNRARNDMKRQSANPLERLCAEELPTGRVAEYRPQRQPTSKAQAAANRARLEAALREDTPAYRHLHAVDTRKAA